MWRAGSRGLFIRFVENAPSSGSEFLLASFFSMKRTNSSGFSLPPPARKSSPACPQNGSILVHENSWFLAPNRRGDLCSRFHTQTPGKHLFPHLAPALM